MYRKIFEYLKYDSVVSYEEFFSTQHDVMSEEINKVQGRDNRVRPAAY